MTTVNASPTIQAAVRRFPLVGRPRPACPALTDRVTEVAEIAATAAAGGKDGGMAEAAHALNLAALIASDCGLPDLARQWCWQHIDVYRQLGTLTTLQAGYLLEPVLNLARLRIRADDGKPALHLLQAMYEAVTSGTDLTVDSHILPLTDLVGTRDELGQLRRWSWLQHLNEGIRILALASRWDDAVHHATALNGIGLHLMEGRQAAVIAQLLHDNTETAYTLLHGSTITEPWEHQVSACLAAISPPPGAADEQITAMTDLFLAAAPTPGYVVYRARLGLTVTTLLADHDETAAQHLLNQLVTEVVDTPDGYAAREVLGHRTTLRIKQPQHRALTQVVDAAGLGVHTMPAPIHETLTEAVRIARRALTHSVEPAAGTNGCDRGSLSLSQGLFHRCAR